MRNKYKYIAYYSNADKAYILNVPDLPGCMADGKDIETARQNLDIAIDEWISVASEYGVHVPVPTDDTFDSTSPSIEDVTYYILRKTGNISTVLLQKLLYYSQAWTLAWYNKPLFKQNFQAWINGPVNPQIFSHFQGCRVAQKDWIKSEHLLSKSEKHVIDSVIEVYGNEDPDWISQLTHTEDPWKNARKGLRPNERSTNTIKQSEIKEYYKQLV